MTVEQSLKIVVASHPELRELFERNELGHVRDMEIPASEWARLWKEAEQQHRDETYEQRFVRVCYRYAWANHFAPGDNTKVNSVDAMNARRLLAVHESVRLARKESLPEIRELVLEGNRIGRATIEQLSKADEDAGRLIAQGSALAQSLAATSRQMQASEASIASQIAVVNNMMQRTAKRAIYVTVACALALLVVLGLVALLALPAHGQLDGLRIENSGGTTIKQWAGGIAKIKCSTNLTCTFGSGVVTIVAAGGGGAGGSCATTPGAFQFDSSGTLGCVTTAISNGTINTFQAGVNFLFTDTGDTTKKARFDLSGISAAATRIIKIPDANSQTIQNGSSDGQIPIWNNSTSTFVPGDPLVQGLTAHDALGTSTNPVAIGGFASVAAPANVSGDGDIVRGWFLLNGAQATVVTAAGALIGGDAANGLDVDVTRSALPTGAATAAKQPALGTAGAASADVITVQGIASMTKLLVTPDSVALPANQSVNVAQINGVTPLMGNGTTGTGSQRVTIASDNTAFAVNNTQQGTASQNVAQFGGTSVVTGTGAGGAGIPRFTPSNEDQNQAFSHTRAEAFKEAAAIGGEMDDTSPVACSEGNVCPVRITPQRAIHNNLRDASGNEIVSSTTSPTTSDRGLGVRNINMFAVGATTTMDSAGDRCSVALQGMTGAGMSLASGTLIGTIVPEISYDEGTTWVASQFFDPITKSVADSIVFAASNGATYRTILSPNGVTNASARVSAFTSGTAQCVARGSNTDAQYHLVSLLDGSKATYRANMTAQACVASAAPCAVLYGSSTKTLRITKVRISGTAGTAALTIFRVNKYSTTPSGGTSTALGTLPMDSTSAATTASSLLKYTAAPTAGTLTGTVSSQSCLLASATVAGTCTSTELFNYGEMPGAQQIVLRGTSQGIGIVTTVAGTIDATIEYAEE